MNHKRLVIILILAIFVVGMTMGSAAAGHTYNKKGYKFTVSNNQYKKIQYIKKHKYDSPKKMGKHKVWFKVKTNKYYKKKPVYASIETHKSNHYYVTYDFYVNGYGYIKWGGTL